MRLLTKDTSSICCLLLKRESCIRATGRTSSISHCRAMNGTSSKAGMTSREHSATGIAGSVRGRSRVCGACIRFPPDFASAASLRSHIRGGKPRIEAVVNGVVVREWVLDRIGLLIIEADVDGTDDHFTVELRVAPEWRAPGRCSRTDCQCVYGATRSERLTQSRRLT